MDKYQDTKEWGGTVLELGIIGAIGTGVGATLLKGNASSGSRGAANAVKRIGKNVDKYMDKTVFRKNPMGRFLYRSLKNVPKSSALIKKDGDQAIAALEFNMNAIGRDTAKERSRLVMQEIADAHMNNRAPRPVEELFDAKAHSLQLQSEAGDKWRSGAHSDYLNTSQKKEDPRRRPNPRGEKKSLASEAVGAAVTGLAFGSGLTAFHALDKKLLGEDKKKEKTYGAAGSYLGGGDMRKQAASGAADMYKKLATFGDKVPLAVANGIGFTGVTIGTASLLEKVRAEARKEVGTDVQQPQVVIVENNNKRKKNSTMTQAHLLTASHPGNYMLSQNAGHADSDMERTAGLAGIPGKLRQFGSDFMGHGDERRRLMDRIDEKSISYQNEAARTATQGDVADIAQHYKKFNPEKANEMALSDIARTMKMQDQQQHDALYDQMARARLTGIGGAAGAAGLASLAIPSKEDTR